MKTTSKPRAEQRQADARATLRAMIEFEQTYVGLHSYAGVDEAGRGCLAGPVYAAAVMLDGDVTRWEGINDSKLLRRVTRERLYDVIVTSAHCVSVGVASVEEIDKHNILQASLLAMSRALTGLAVPPTIALIDGPHAPRAPTTIQCHAVVDGDARCLSIAAASIVAKVERDRHMCVLDEQYPDYGFQQHVGYGTAAHLRALQRFGPCAQHRRSFAPIRAFFQTGLGLD